MMKASGSPLLTIKMEELVTRPVATLSEACAFLGMAFDDAMLQGTSSDHIRPECRRDSFDPSTTALPQRERCRPS